MTAKRLEIEGPAITAYDPADDPNGRTMTAATAVSQQIANAVRFQPTLDTG